MSESKAWRARVRIGFFAYAAVLFVATHWPALTVPGEGRKDLVIHVGAFAVWTFLLVASRFFGGLWSGRNILTSSALAAVYSAVDEGLQAVPWIRRVAAWDDGAANVGGVALACMTCLGIAALIRRWRGGTARSDDGG